MDKVGQINKVLKDFFDKHPQQSIIPAKDLMPLFINAGIFSADHRLGLPIRELLRNLDAQNKLSSISYVVAERKAANTQWYFSRSISSIAEKSDLRPQTKKAGKKRSRDNSDEWYILDLCDSVLKINGDRQHYFEFLRGDSGRKLSVDIFYPTLQLAIEFAEKQHTEAVAHFDKPEQLTVSGVHRGEQRRIYDQRKKDVLPTMGIMLLEIHYSHFSFSSSKKLLKNPKNDRLVVEGLLQNLIPKIC